MITTYSNLLSRRGVFMFMMLIILTGCNKRPKQVVLPAAPRKTSAILFHDAAQTAGISHRLGHKKLDGLTALDTIGHGCAFLDYDGDGNLDILLLANDHCILYHNRGDGTFDDVTDLAFPDAPRLPTLIGCAVADYDGDGRLDIFISGYGRTILYHNEGNGRFRDVTVGSGLEARGPDDWSTSAAWADVESNGSLDLYVCRYVRFTPRDIHLCRYAGLNGSDLQMACGPLNYEPQKGSLYRNLGNGKFRDVTTEAGLSAAHGNALGCMFCDYNHDGKPDLYVANDELQGDLFLNIGGGRFKNVAVETGVAYNANAGVPAGMGLDWGDYDGDGRFDLLVSDFASQPKSLFHNDGKAFTQASYPSGVGAATAHSLAFGAAFIDADNDGRPDIVTTNGHVLSQVELTDRGQTYVQATQILHNVGGRFEDVSAGAGSDFGRKIVGRGISIGDYDGDGRMDMLIVDDEGPPLLLHNDSSAKNHWITLKCTHIPGGPDAIGAYIAVSVEGRKQIAEVRASGSYLSSNAPDIHFGIGNATIIDTIEIEWPGGKTSRVSSVPADRIYRISPGDQRLTEIKQKK